MRCVTTVSYEVCVNGSFVGPIIPNRGLRQGDPLSPYLFLFCVEGLSNLLDNARQNNLIHGCRISPLAPDVTHLLFADDSFMFFNATTEEATRIKGILDHYAAISGQAVNFQKSGIMFSSNIRRDKQAELSNILGVHNDIESSNYLGLPSLVGRSKKRVFGFLKERVMKRIQSWSSKPISRAGKSVLVRNVLQAIPSYTMSCFLLPKTLSQEIERAFNGYWWQSGSDIKEEVKWHAWDAMSMPKGKGGLGFKNLYGFNIALLGKHIWKCIQDPNALVSRILKARYFPGVHILNAEKGQGSSFLWLGIWQAKEVLKGGFRWVVGDGNDIVATKDQWLVSKMGFKVDDSHRYAGRNERVSSLFYPGSKIWDVRKVQDFFSVGDASAILATRVPQHVVRDRIAWSSSNNGMYDVKSGYRFWFDQNGRSSEVTKSKGWSRLWNLVLPHKMKIFLWRFCRNNIPIRN